MRRTVNKTPRNSTQAGKRLTLRDAMETIEAMQKEIRALKPPNSDADFSDEEPDDEFSPKVKRGPKPAFGDGLYRKRDEMVSAIEYYWPEIEPTCHPELHAEALRGILVSISELPKGHHSPHILHLLENFSVLLEFLGTDRFRGDPQQIANAMAGVPRISFWRSLKICQHEPCWIGPGLRAVKAYVKRKHPRLYETIELDPTSLPHFLHCMKHYNTREPNMAVYKSRPVQLMDAWKAARIPPGLEGNARNA